MVSAHFDVTILDSLGLQSLATGYLAIHDATPFAQVRSLKQLDAGEYVLRMNNGRTWRVGLNPTGEAGEWVPVLDAKVPDWLSS